MERKTDRLEIKRQFPGKYTDAQLNKMVGKNKEQIIDQYFKEEDEEEEGKKEPQQDAQDLYPNYFNQDDSCFAYVNPMLYESGVPSTSNRAFPSDMTPQKYPPKQNSLSSNPNPTEDFDDDDDDSEEEDEEEEEAIRTINSMIRSNKKAIKDIKAFTSPKGQSSQTPLSSDNASFGTQGAYSQPVFDNDESIYTKSFISGLEDDEKHLKIIREMEKEATKRRKSRIPKPKKVLKLVNMPSIADQKEDKKDDGNNDNDDLNDFFASVLES